MHGVVATGDHEGIAVMELHGLQPTLEEEVVEIEPGPFLTASQEAYVDVAAPLRIDAARAGEEAENRIGRDARELTRCTHESGHEHAHRLGGFE